VRDARQVFPFPVSGHNDLIGGKTIGARPQSVMVVLEPYDRRYRPVGDQKRARGAVERYFRGPESIKSKPNDTDVPRGRSWALPTTYPRPTRPSARSESVRQRNILSIFDAGPAAIESDITHDPCQILVITRRQKRCKSRVNHNWPVRRPVKLEFLGP